MAKKSRPRRGPSGSARRADETPESTQVSVGEPARQEGEALAPFPIVGIGASAGRLEAFSELLDALPTNRGMALGLVQHPDPSHGSMLTEIMSRATAMPVSEARDGTKVLANHVYVTPPGIDLTIVDGTLHLAPRTETRGQHRSIDHFLRS